ncbi:MAG: nitrile hydratase subunit beta [Alphaproteobacteria bacterium]|nr:MAG: nitrile hydratase subunit beta [Alphaproteobacteria bacterium]
MTTRFNPGDTVRVLLTHPPGHRRTPHYIRGKTGVVALTCGAYANPEELAYGFDGLPKKEVYKVRFAQKDVWPDYRGPDHDTVDIDIFEHWLRPA